MSTEFGQYSKKRHTTKQGQQKNAPTEKPTDRGKTSARPVLAVFEGRRRIALYHHVR
jgi:uncharacterized membrane protein